MKKREWIIGLVLLVALASLFSYEQHKHPFNWSMFIEGFQKADWRKVVIGAGCIYFAFVFRAVRWAWLLRHNKKVPLLSLLGTQVMGFTAVALIGRIADLVRPYLVAKKTGLTVGSQIAVYVVERLFDAGSMAILFCAAILFSPSGSLPHQDVFNKFGKGGLILTIAGGLFLVAIRMSGSAIAGFCETILNPLSRKLAHGVGQKIRAFHSGLDTLRSPADFIITLSLSLGDVGPNHRGLPGSNFCISSGRTDRIADAGAMPGADGRRWRGKHYSVACDRLVYADLCLEGTA